MAEILAEQEDTAPGRLVVCTSHQEPYTSFYADGEFKESWTYLLLGGTLELKNPSSSNVDYKLKLDTIEYDKRVFSPCLFTLHFSVTESNTSEPLGSLLKKVYHLMECELFVQGSALTTNPTTYQRRYIAQSYFIHSFRIDTRKNAVECVFNCYSMDRKITVGKGCEVFTASKFGEQIFKARLDKCADMAGKYDFNCCDLVMTGFHGAVGYRDGYRNEMQKDGTTTQKVGHDVELIHPYIVRYNESLYDFFARVAHRCGEFLYFEDGQLHLGLPETTRKVLLATAGEADGCISFNPYPKCTFPNVPIGEGKSDAKGFSSDYARGIQEVGESGCYFDMQNTSDDHLYNVQEDDNIGGVSGWWMLINALSTLFSASDIIAGLAQAALDVVSSLIYAEGIIPDKLGKDYEKYLGDGAAFSSNLKKPDNSAFDPLNLCNSFFHKVETLEKKAERSSVTMCFSSTFPFLSLCSAVHPFEGSSPYVVTRVNGRFSSEENSSADEHYAEGVPIFTDAGIDSWPAVAVPPRGNVPHYITSGPAEAIVDQNDDPLRLGRVRIRYPWQVSGDSQISPWLRVPVPFSGGGGVTMTPSVGEHVIVDYLAENMERPYVGGSYFFRYGSEGEDSHRPVGVASGNTKKAILPANTAHTIASGKGHRISFSDGPDSSLLSQLIPLVDSILKLCGVANPALPIKGGGITLSDGSELCKISLSGDRRSVTIQSNWGTVNMSAFTGISISAPNGDVVIRGKNVSIEAGNNLVLKSGTNIKSKEQSAGDTVASILGTLIGKLAVGTLVSYTGVDLNGCADLSLLRCILDIVLRPVEGTLTVQSGRNVIFTSGKGVVTVPASCLSGEDKRPSGRVANAIRKACGIIDDYFSDLKNYYDATVTARGKYKNIYDKGTSFMANFRTKDDFKKFRPDNDDFKNEVIKETTTFPVVADVVGPPLPDTNRNAENIAQYNEISEAYADYKNKVKKYLDFAGSGGTKDFMDKRFKKFESSGKYKVQHSQFPGDYQCFDTSTDENKKKLLATYPTDAPKHKTVLKRSAVVQIILTSGDYVYFLADDASERPKQAFGYTGEVNPFKSEDKLKAIITRPDAEPAPAPVPPAPPPPPKWSDLLSSITTYKKKEKDSKVKAFAKSAVGSLAGTFTGGGYDSTTGQWTVFTNARKLVNYNGEAGPRAYSELTGDSAILFSNTKGKTLVCRNDTNWESIPNGDGADIAQLVKELNLILN